MIVVKAQIKEVAKEFNISGDFAETLDRKVTEIVLAACERARANNRRTIMAKDL